MVTFAIVAILAAYLALSIHRQIALVFPTRDRHTTVARAVPWRNRWLPVWIFFSAVPDHDIHLLIRDRLIDRQWAPWRAAPYRCVRGLRWLWNPDRRRAKGIADLWAALAFTLARLADPSTADVATTGPYRVLLTYARGLPRSPLSDERQFMLAKAFAGRPEKPPEILFISPPFPLA